MIFLKFAIAYLVAVIVIWGFMYGATRLSKREEELMMRDDLKK